MIIQKKQTIFLFLILLSVGFYSCQESEFDSLENSEEGYLGTTENNSIKQDVLENIDVLELPDISEPVYHMSYDASLTEEEAFAKFKVDEAKFLDEYSKHSKKGVSTEWWFIVYLETGVQTDNQTNGRSSLYTSFKTDKGYVGANYSLPNAGKTKGAKDFYGFRAYYPMKPVHWVQLICTQLSLIGTDGWFPKVFNVAATNINQSVPAVGATRINAKPNVWLDSHSSSGTSYYWNCNSSQRGLLAF